MYKALLGYPRIKTLVEYDLADVTFPMGTDLNKPLNVSKRLILKAT